MADTATFLDDAPLVPTTPTPPVGDTNWLSTLYRAPGLLAKGLAPGAIANFLAPSPDVAAQTSSLPGIITGNVSGLGTLLDIAGKTAGRPFDIAENYVRDKLGLSPAPPPAQKPQFLTDWGKAYEGSVARATNLMPEFMKPDPQNAAEEAIVAGGNAVGGMLGAPIPARAIAALPRVLQLPASFVAPLAGVTKPAIPLAIGATAPLAVEEGAKFLQTGPQTQTSQQREQPAQSTAAVPSTQPQLPAFMRPSQPTGDTQLPLFMQPSQTAPQLPSDKGADGGESDVTGLGVAGGLAALIAAGLAAKYHTRIPGLARAIDRPGYLADAKAFNDAQALRAAGDPTQTMQMANQPTGPLAMGPVEARARAAQTALQDKNATLAAHIDEIAGTNNDLSHSLGIVNQNASPNMRVASTFETGRHEATGVQLPSQATMDRDIGRLTPDEQQILHSGLYARNTLDNRADMFNKVISQGNFDPRAYRVGLHDMSDADLRTMVTRMESNPKLNDIADRYRGIMLGNLDIMERSGFPTADLARVRRVNPGHVPTTDADGLTMRTFGLRETEPYSGSQIPPTTPWDAASQHNSELYRMIEMNNLQRDFVDMSLRAQSANPNLAKLVERKLDYAGKDVTPADTKDSITIYRPSGKETYLIHNKEILDALKRNPTQVNAILAATRRQFQSGITGIPGAIFGKVFAPVEAARSIGYLPGNVPKGFASGYADKLFQKYTGRNLRILADQPISAPIAGAMDAGNRMMFGAANMLERNSTNYGNVALRHYFGDAKVDSWRQSMMDRYLASPTYRMRAAGAVGGLGYRYTEAPAYKSSAHGLAYHNPSAEMAPFTYRGSSQYTIPNWLHQKVLPYTVIPRKILNEANDIVSNMGHSLMWRLNENNPNISRPQLVREVRQLTGDMGVSGGGSSRLGTFIQHQNAYVPFTNAATQDVASLTRNTALRPVATPLSHIANLSMLAAGSLYTAMHVPGALHHLFNTQSTAQRASGPVYYTDPNDPTKFTQLSIAQNMRGLYPIILDLMGHATEAWNAHSDEGAFNRAYHTLGSMLSHHLSNNTITSSIHGASQMVDPYTSLPPAANVLINAVGKEWNLRPDQIIEGLKQGKPFTSIVARDSTQRTHAPNQAGGDTALDSPNGNVITHVLSSLYGIAGGAWESAERGLSSAHHGGSASEIIGHVLDNWGQHFKDQNPMFNNILWKNSGKVSASSPLVESVNKSLDAIQQTATATGDLRFEGATRRGGQPLSNMGDPKVVNDPLVKQMYVETGRVAGYINSRLKPQVTDLRKLRDDLPNTQISETEKRDKENAYNLQINDKYHELATVVDRLNKRLSQLAGRPVDVTQIDWSKDRSQFSR